MYIAINTRGLEYWRLINALGFDLDGSRIILKQNAVCIDSQVHKWRKYRVQVSSVH